MELTIDGWSVVSLRNHVDGRETRVLRTESGAYRWDMAGRQWAEERYATFFGAMVAANKFVDVAGHDCQRLGCQSWLIGASARSAMALLPALPDTTHVEVAGTTFETGPQLVEATQGRATQSLAV